MMDLYKRLPPLEDGQIRLLQVSEWSEHEGITCTLVPVSLHDFPAYFALSYTWGLPFPDYKTKSDLHYITCNGQRIPVKPNLYDFLLHCAGHADPAFRGRVWIDALCIDQDNHPERSRQVQLIGDIYKLAAYVVVWLGVEDDSTASAVELMREFAATDPRKRSKRVLQSDVLSERQDLLSDSEHWHAMAHFFDRTWFQRAWIIQEITFSRRAIVLCGPYELKWEEITTVSGFIATEFSATSIWSNYFETETHVDAEFAESVRTRRAHFPAKLAATKASQALSSGDGLLYALIRARASKCEDSRDKVYSQLKLGNANIFPTYDDDEAKVYITAATYILQHSDNLLLLTCAEGTDFQRMRGLPSWVPDWSVAKDLGLRVTGYQDFNAAGSLPRHYALLPEHRLQIRAAKIDTITGSAETKGELLDFSRPTTLWDMLAELDDTYAATGQPKEEVLWRTLMTNRGHGLHSNAITYPASRSPLQESFASWVLWRYLAAAAKSPSLSSSTFPLPAAGTTLLPSREAVLSFVSRASAEDRIAMEKAASVFHSHYSHALFVRPFRTQKGLVGLGTQSLRKGDTVWIVAGCRVPLILREVVGSTRYRLVGGTSLHGFMNGEALQLDGVNFEMVELE